MHEKSEINKKFIDRFFSLRYTETTTKEKEVFCMKRNHLVKKVTALVTTAAVLIGCPTLVMAESTYVDTEKAEIQKLITSMTENWDAEMEVLEQDQVNANAKLAVAIEEGAATLIGSLAGIDLSWLGEVALDMDVSLIDDMEAINLDLLLNGTSLATAQVFLDMAAQAAYISAPEIVSGYLTASLEEAGASVSTEAVMDVLPNADVLTAILERYTSLFLDYIEEGASIEENISVEGIGEDCTLYEGIIRNEKSLEIAEAILTTVRDDQEVKMIVEAMEAADPTLGDVYAQFQTAIDDYLAEIQNSETPEAGYISSKVWVCADGKIVAREIGYGEGVETVPLVTWKNPHSGTDTGLLLEIQGDGSSITVVGSGTETDGLVNGQYIFAIDGIEMLHIAVENYDAAGAAEGYPNGTYTISIPEGVPEDMAMLAIFELVLNLKSDKETDSNTVELLINCMGDQMGSVTISGETSEEAVEIPDFSSAEPVYDAASEEDMEALTAAVSFDTIIENALSAGVPEEIMDQLVEMIIGTEEVSMEEAA